MSKVEYEAKEVASNNWEVRPKGQTGVGGFIPVPWRVCKVFARNASEALDLAARLQGRVVLPHSVYPVGVTRVPRELLPFKSDFNRTRPTWGQCKPKHPPTDDRPPDSAA